MVTDHGEKNAKSRRTTTIPQPHRPNVCHTRTTYNYTFTIYTPLHPHLEQPYTHKSVHIIILSVHISTQTSTHQHTSAHISTHHYLISTHHYLISTHLEQPYTHKPVHIIILLVHIWNSLTHTNQYTSLSYQYTSVHKSVHISTHQYKSVHISTHHYLISTLTHIHARKTHTTIFPPTDIHPLNTHTYTSTYTAPPTQ